MIRWLRTEKGELEAQHRERSDFILFAQFLASIALASAQCRGVQIKAMKASQILDLLTL